MRKRFTYLGLAVLLFFLALPAEGQDALSTTHGLPRVAAGTLVEDPDAGRWNRVVLLARPKVASGDVDAMPATIRKAVSTFVLTILATVEPSTDAATGESKFTLSELGLGYSMLIDGRLTVVTRADADRIGADLGFIQTRLLSENEKQLATVKIVARTSTLAIFDAPAILNRDSEHRDFVMRHFVWIDPITGRNAALVWLLERDDRGRLTVVADEPLRWLPPGLKEEREIHVDGQEFSLLGIPTPRAFALQDLPPGKPVAWNPAALALAARDSFDSDTLRELTIALNAALN